MNIFQKTPESFFLLSFFENGNSYRKIMQEIRKFFWKAIEVARDPSMIWT